MTQSLLERVEQMLTALEWSRDDDCPECDSDGTGKHKDYCALAALLAEVRKELATASSTPPRPSDETP